MQGPVPTDEAVPATSGASSWSSDAVIYQVYVRSFADSNGDGVGDIAGIVSRLDYLVGLGVDALWLTPFYTSPMADGGYDVADYRDVDRTLGTLDDVDKLLVEAHSRGLRVIIDLVPNHCSDQHPWFQAALAAGPGSPERARFHFRSGPTPPNNWQSIFRGPAWTQLPDGDWYLHLFAPEQPDLNWDHPEVRAEFADVLRFWLDRGVDGIRIDVAHGLVKVAGLPDTVDSDGGLLDGATQPYFDQDGVHEIYREWRAILDEYQPERIAVAEAWLPSMDRVARYVRPGELHQAFNFEFLAANWSGPVYRHVIDSSLSAMATVAAPTTWVLSNHDVVRHASRLAIGAGGMAGGAGPAGDGASQIDRAVGLRRARAAILLTLALPGSVYLYQGEELGLPEVFDLPAEARQDPIFARSGGTELGRDGCRVPLPWSGGTSPYGFGPDGSTPWLPVPAEWAGLSVRAQQADPSSTLHLYTSALRLRRELAALGAGELRWHSGPDDQVLVFLRPGSGGGPGLLCALNQSGQPVELAALGLAELGVDLDAPPAISSERWVADGQLAGDTAAWWTIQ
jgi:alpha-glucosidase